MVRMKMSPERPVLGTMSTTSAFLRAGSPARRRPVIFTRRPAPMRRGIGMGGSTTPFLAWPSGPMSSCRTVSTPTKLNQCGGNSVPLVKRSGSRLNAAAARRTAITPTSSSVARTRPTQGARSFIASSIQPAIVSISSPSIGRRLARRPEKKKGLRVSPVARRHQRPDTFPAPVHTVIGDPAVLDVHRFEQVELFAVRRLAWILPGQQLAVGEEQPRPVELLEVAPEDLEKVGKQLPDLAASLEDGVLAVVDQRQDRRRLHRGVLGIEGEHAFEVACRHRIVPLLVDVADLCFAAVGRHGRSCCEGAMLAASS